jgi:hypothetical protein
MRAPRHLGCNGRIVVYSYMTDEAWCLCRRRWPGNALTVTLEDFVKSVRRLGLALSSAYAEVVPSVTRAAESFRELGRVMMRMEP